MNFPRWPRRWSGSTLQCSPSLDLEMRCLAAVEPNSIPTNWMHRPDYAPRASPAISTCCPASDQHGPTPGFDRRHVQAFCSLLRACPVTLLPRGSRSSAGAFIAPDADGPRNHRLSYRLRHKRRRMPPRALAAALAVFADCVLPQDGLAPLEPVQSYNKKSVGE